MAGKTSRATKAEPEPVRSGDVFGIPTREQALASVTVNNQEGGELSDGQREQIADRIEAAAQANASWRAGLPYEQQAALVNVPVISVAS